MLTNRPTRRRKDGGRAYGYSKMCKYMRLYGELWYYMFDHACIRLSLDERIASVSSKFSNAVTVPRKPNDTVKNFLLCFNLAIVMKL